MVKALEDLPIGSVEAVVLLAPAISPDYDLSKALKAVSREMVVFWSPLDVIVLGAGGAGPSPYSMGELAFGFRLKPYTVGNVIEIA